MGIDQALPGRHAGTASGDAEGGQSSGPRGRILVAEDDDGLRRAAARALERRGYVVLQAADGREALELFREEDEGFDLVLADVFMPELDGIDLWQAVTQSSPATPFLFTSGHAEQAVVQAAGIGQKHPFLPKPWTVSQLVESVEAVLGC